MGEWGCGDTWQPNWLSQRARCYNILNLECGESILIIAHNHALEMGDGRPGIIN
jgi:hypothetical protein